MTTSNSTTYEWRTTAPAGRTGTLVLVTPDQSFLDGIEPSEPYHRGDPAHGLARTVELARAES